MPSFSIRDLFLPIVSENQDIIGFYSVFASSRELAPMTLTLIGLSYK